jgi:cytochrome c oxidase subunit 3
MYTSTLAPAHPRTLAPPHPRTQSLREDQVRLGLWMFLATVTMLFAAFVSAYIVRRSGSDWRHVSLPPILWLNTLILIASSVALEAASHSGLRLRWQRAEIAMGAALSCGLGFLAGQLVAWRAMMAAGVYLPTSPHASFFFVITGAHALHVIAALAVLTWGALATPSGASDVPAWAARMELCRTFWHYLGAVWLVLFALVSLY